MDVVWHAFVAFDWIGLVVVPLLIVAARVTDVSMGTLRVVFIGRGMAVPAALVGFVESLVWLLAVSQILKHLTLPLYYVAYAGGFALGNYVGLRIESWMALGNVVVRVITNQSTEALAAVFTEDVIMEWPQSGERIRGSRNRKTSSQAACWLCRCA